MGNNLLRQTLSAIIVFVFCTQICTEGFADPIPRFLPHENISDFSLSDTLKDPSEFSESEKVVLEKLFQQPLRTSLELMFLLTTLNRKLEQLESEIGEEALLKRILAGVEKEEVKIEVPGVGKAEYNKIGDIKRGRVFVRVIHYNTGVVFNFYDTEVFNRTYLSEENETGANLSLEEIESRRYLREQFKLYEARQIMHTPNNHEPYESLKSKSVKSNLEVEELTQKLLQDALDNPPTKNYDSLKGYKTRGRDVVNIFHSSSNAEYIEKLDRKTQLKGFNRVKLYWKSIREKPQMPMDYDLAMVSTTLQSGATLGVGIGLFLATGTFDVIPTCLSVIWAGVVGVNIRTYQSWLMLSKSKTTQYLKGILLSLSFNYTFIFINEGIKALNRIEVAPTTPAEYIAVFLTAGLAALSVVSIEGVKNHFHSMTNTIINNWAKTKLGEIPRERTRANMNQNEVRILGRTLNQGYMEAQVASGTGSVLKLLDLIDVGGKIDTPVGGFSWGRILFLISGFVASYANVLYTEKHDLKGKKVNRQMWESYKFKITFGTTEGQYTLHVPMIGIVFNPLAKLADNSFKLMRTFMEGFSKQMIESTVSLFEASTETPANKTTRPIAKPFDRVHTKLCSNLFGKL